MRLTRRRALQSLLGIPGASLLRGQELAGEPLGRITPLAEVVNVFEVQAMARRKLADAAFATIAGTDRRALERITFRPRLMVNVSQLDLTTEIFGEKMFAPIIIAPVSQQQTFHADGEVATAKGASAAKTTMIVSSRSSRPLAEVVAASTTPLWFQVYADQDIKGIIDACQKAVGAGCTAVCLTIGVPYQRTGSGRLETTGNVKLQWASILELKRSLKVPLILKGVMSPEEAQTSVANGIDAVVVSNHGGMFTTGFADPIEMLPAVAEAVGGKIPILIDGSFRRGTDVLKAVALGARAVLVGRPVIWGLAAYGSDGVRLVLEMLQTELGRSMAMCGKPNVKSVGRELVRIHKR